MGLATIFKKLLIGRAISTKKGRIALFEKMDYVMYPAVGLAITLQEIAEKNGEDFLFDISYKASLKAGEEMIKLMGLKPRTGHALLNTLSEFLEFTGYGKLEFITSKIEKDHHHLIIHIKDNPTVEYAKQIYGSKSMVCGFFRGMYSAYGNLIFGIKMKFKENKCFCRGAPYCEFESKG